MKKKLLYAICILISIAILAFAYYTISPFFINIKVDDINPASDTRATTTATTITTSSVTVATTSVRTTAPIGVVGTAGHPASGTVRLIEADGKRYIRYENFKTINGPDIYVYLSKDLDAKEFVNLGRVRATEGNINYEIPAEVNVSNYPYVLTWCEAFGVLFNSAKLP